MTRRAMLGVVLLLTLLGGAMAVLPHASALAQGTAIDCPAPATPAASLATGSEAAEASPAATQIAFPKDRGELTVFSAASLSEAFERMKTDLQAAHPDLTITYNFGGSQALVTQLSEGAAADVFASANIAQMQAAIANGSISGEPATFVRNRLAIVTPAENPAGIAAPADLGQPGLRLVLAQPEVPAGRYAREVICAMSRDAATYGEGFVERVAANIVSEEEDVRDALAKVQLGEADAGIVYVSDAKVAGEAVRLIAIPDEVNIVASYPIAAVTGGDAALSDAFIAYVLSPEGQATLAGFGFEPVSSPEMSAAW